MSLALLLSMTMAACGSDTPATANQNDAGTAVGDGGTSAVGDGGTSAVGDGGTSAITDATTDTNAGDAYAASVLEDGPIHYWRLGDATLPAKDSVGNVDLPGLGTPELGVPGAIAGDAAMRFVNAESDCLTIANASTASFDAASTFTLEAWAANTQAGSGSKEIISKLGADGNGYALGVIGNDNIRVRMGAGPSSIDYKDTTSLSFLTPNRWYHFVAIVDAASNKVTLYVDGVKQISASSAVKPLATNGTLAIGCQNGGTGTSGYFDGMIDEVAIYAKALPEARILAHHNAAARN